MKFRPSAILKAGSVQFKDGRPAIHDCYIAVTDIFLIVADSMEAAKATFYNTSDIEKIEDVENIKQESNMKIWFI